MKYFYTESAVVPKGDDVPYFNGCIPPTEAGRERMGFVGASSGSKYTYYIKHAEDYSEETVHLYHMVT